MSGRPAINLRTGGRGNRVGAAALPSFVVKDQPSEARERIKYTREQLLQLRHVAAPSKYVLKIKRDIDVDLFGENKQQRGSVESNFSDSPQGRFIERDKRDWHRRSPNLPASVEERTWDASKENRGFSNRYSSRRTDGNRYQREENMNCQFSRAQISTNQVQRPAPALVKAVVPWSARKGSISEQDRVLKTVKGILNKLTPETFDRLTNQIVYSGITSADILKRVISLIFDKAVLEPTFCFMYAKLCSALNEKLPPFSSDEPGGKDITFKRLLLNNCQEAFENADKLREELKLMNGREHDAEHQEKEKILKLRTLGNIKLIGELLKQNIVPQKLVHHIVQELLGGDNKVCPAEENVEGISQFFLTIGKQLDEEQKSKRINDMYFSRLKELTMNKELAPRLRFMIQDLIDLRANKWIPRRKEVKAKTINEIHIEAEQDLKLRPGATAGMRNWPSGSGGFPMIIPGTGGRMPGMPQARMMTGLLNDSYEWEVPRNRSIPRGNGSVKNGGSDPPVLCKLMSGNSYIQSQSQPNPAFQASVSPSARPSSCVTDPASQNVRPQTPTAPNPAELAKKTKSLLEEYLNIKLLNEAQLCIEELKSPAYHPEIIKEAISYALDKGQSCIDQLSSLLQYLFTKKIFTSADIGTGCILYASMLADIAIDLPKAPSNFGLIIGKAVLASLVDFKLVHQVLTKVEDDIFQKAILNAAMHIISCSPSGQAVLTSQVADIRTCRSLFQ